MPSHVSAALDARKPLDPEKFRGAWGAKDAPGRRYRTQWVGDDSAKRTTPRFGPWQHDDAFHHVSRQACRAYLRALWFNKISKEQPQLSRRDRRRVSRVFACLEYKETVN